MSFIASEPAVVWTGLVAALVNALIIFAPQFGLHLTTEEQAALAILANAILAVVVRQQVTPTSSAVAGPAAPKAS